jgi:anthranilate phosphoribosyltransferase
VAGLADSLADGVGRAQALLASGAGLERVHALATLTHTLTDA